MSSPRPAAGWLATSSYSITGSALAHVFARYTGASIGISGVTVTLTGTPSFAAYALAQSLAMIEQGGCTFSGSATGARYSAAGNSLISVSGAGASYLPGSSAGVTATGALYV